MPPPLYARTQDTRRIEIYTGRPLRVIKNKSNDDWANRESEMRELLGKGIVPIGEMMKTGAEQNKTPSFLRCHLILKKPIVAKTGSGRT